MNARSCWKPRTWGSRRAGQPVSKQQRAVEGHLNGKKFKWLKALALAPQAAGSSRAGGADSVYRGAGHIQEAICAGRDLFDMLPEAFTFQGFVTEAVLRGEAAGAAVDAKTKDGVTALHAAVECGRRLEAR